MRSRAACRWSRRRRLTNSAFTLLEVVLVIGILAVIAVMVTPNLVGEIEGKRLETSARQMRSLVQTVRANAMFDGKRYRLRFPEEDEIDEEGDDRQPLVEREDNPIEEPGEYTAVDAPWVLGETFLRDVWCAQVRLGKPTIERIERGYESNELPESALEEFDDEDPDFPPLVIEPDGTCEWATFVLTNVPRERDVEELDPEEDAILEVILDGVTGLVWLQRPFFEEELDMLDEHNWPPVMRQDFLRPQLLTEDEVLEIQERTIRMSGRSSS